MKQDSPAGTLSQDLEPFWNTLAHCYRLERELGRGGMATVYLVHDLKHARSLALKIMHPELAAGLGPRRFLREIQLAAGLDHPHIMPVYDSGEAAGQLWYVMPYVEGESLRERLKREGRLSVRDAVRIARGIADALDYAHTRAVIHRDIKPENILLSGQTPHDRSHARLTDFGVAKAVEARGGEPLTRVGFAVGTPAYMSPEQASGEPVDARSDLYSLACVLYEMLAGITPYTGPSAQAIIVKAALGPVPLVRAARPDVSEALEALISRTLSSEPAERCGSASDFAAALEESLTSQSSPAFVVPAKTARPLDGPVERGRDAYRRRAWSEAHAELMLADRETGLEPEDVERLAITCLLLGRDAAGAEVLERAHQAFLAHGASERAARVAFWLAFTYRERGETARAGGWVARLRRLLGGLGRESVEAGYLLFLDAMRALMEGDNETALATLDRVAALGERFGDRDLLTLTCHAQGRCLIRSGQVTDGLALLDEAMVAVTSDEVSPYIVGGVYCSVISGCQEIFDWRRAQEWTTVMSRWCAPQPELVTYRGQCLLRRSEVLQLLGDWSGAMDEAQRALARMVDPPDQVGTGAVYFQLGELHRLRGELAEAEEAYRQTSRCGRSPQPGLSLLHMAQGDVEGGLTSIRRTLDETQQRRLRPVLLAACVELAIAANELDTARTAAEELAVFASEIGVPYLHALSARATGAVRLAEGDARAALGTLRESEAIWHGIDAPYEAARTRVLIGRARQALGDASEVELDLDAAASVFEQLGAGPDLRQVERLRRRDRALAP